MFDRYQIKAEIYRRGSTLVGLSRTAGLELSAVRTALIRPHPPGERAIAAFLGMSPDLLWPDRYAKRRRHHAKIVRVCECQKSPCPDQLSGPPTRPDSEAE